ncbi:MAG: winged helix-turn-helix transcriptional regulator [Acidimicrobiia bacterium]|nr:winged helix-turn-helix transcriptional regulator [Acidimicrobiia bacterium]MDH4308654.1 winged helix-turn-helix transcriptional regulator [Acidimicrobiia bacterium]MDH5294799.1 winged helix-turn-helix transcriptional regulator [Acidimicrobiia bacterium]
MSWTFFTNHAHVLFCISQNPTSTLRDVASQVGITERATQRIVADLEAGGYLVRERVGRRNQYEVRADVPLRHPIETHVAIGKVLEVLRPAP